MTSFFKMKYTFPQNVSIASPYAARKVIFGAVAATALLFGSHAAALDEGVLASVNGTPIDEKLLGVVIQQLETGGQQIDEQGILNELINLELLRQLAVENGIDKQDDIANVLHLQETQILANAYMRDISENTQLSDEEMLAEYEAQSARMDASEYRASHILLESEEDANAIIEALEKGADFVELAKEKSTGPSGPNGGDLGWFKPESMVAEFSDAVTKMTVGATSDVPVKSDFGWHVIKLDETRGSPVPPFEEVKDQIRNVLMRTRMNEKIAELREEASVEFAE